jgi:adenylate cyclase
VTPTSSWTTSPENVRLLEAVLTSRGYNVISATDGRVALELAASAKPDLVLLDVVMPQMDGYAVCRRLRESEETAVLPVVIVTESQGAEKTKAIEAGADDLIAKPLNPRRAARASSGRYCASSATTTQSRGKPRSRST